MAFLEVKNICKGFAGTEVLRGIGFSMEKGEVLVIIGSSGSGKTTLLRCLNFLERPDSGSISLNGEALFDAAGSDALTDEQIRQKRLHFGLVFQQFNLFPQYSVIDNITLAPLLEAGARLKKGKASRAALREESESIRANAVSILESVGLGARQSAYPCELSGGQQQRVAIARALAMKPDILCFDEPTSALDPELTGEVLRVIRSLKGGDRTMIVVTHEMEFARGVADRVIYMADGVIEEQGTPDEVFGAPKSPKTQAFLRRAGNTVS